MLNQSFSLRSRQENPRNFLQLRNIETLQIETDRLILLSTWISTRWFESPLPEGISGPNGPGKYDSRRRRIDLHRLDIDIKCNMYVIQTEPAMRLRPAKQIRICCFSSNGFEFPNSQAVMNFPAKKGVTKPAKEIPTTMMSLFTFFQFVPGMPRLTRTWHVTWYIYNYIHII